MTQIELPAGDFARQFRLPPLWISILLVLWGTAMILAGDTGGPAAVRNAFFALALYLYAAAAAVVLVAQRYEQVARWCAVGAIWLPMLVLVSWTGHPVAIALLPLPIALAASMLSLPATIGIAAATSIALIVLPAYAAPLQAAQGYLIMGQTGVWLMVVALYLAHRPTREAVQWAWQHFARAQQLLDQARTRNVELDSLLDELLHANRQLDLLNERLAAMRAHAEAAQQAKGAFIAKVSHEFRTPLNMIIGLTDLVVESPTLYGTVPPKLVEDIRIVHRNCTHLAAMVDDVLYLSQTESGRLTLHKSWTDLRQELHAAADVVRPLFRQKGLALQIQIDAGLPQIYCDATRIRQVILNLLSNAARYTDQGSVTVAAATQEMYVLVCVTDTGPGIAAKDASHIFEPFYQGSTRAGHAQEGTGLGLSICKQFVELHEGKLWLESELGVGTTFFVRLPAAPLGAPASGAARWIAEEWTWRQRTNRPELPPPSQQPRIVLYDENGQLAALARRRGEEIEFTETPSLEAAAAAVTQVPAHALFVNTDNAAHLPALVHQLGSAAPDTPVFGCAFPSQAERILRAGAIDYLIKPVVRSELLETLQALEPQPHHVLIVDDDDEFRSLLVRMLHSCNGSLAIDTAADGRAALERMRQQPPDLVFLDIMLPYLTGWEVLAQKERDELIRPIPVIILSSQDPTEEPDLSPVLVASAGRGWPVDRAFQAALALSRFLLSTEENHEPQRQPAESA